MPPMSLIPKCDTYYHSRYVGTTLEIQFNITDSAGYVFENNDFFMYLRGWLVPRGFGQMPDSHSLFEAVVRDYQYSLKPAVRQYEGSYTLLIFDKTRQQLWIYRNIIGTDPTYYCNFGKGLYISGNLSDLVNYSGIPVKPNRNVLPAFFLFRYSPGQSTLCEGIQRLMPGELLRWDGKSLNISQEQTFRDYEAPYISSSDAIESVERAMSCVLRDCLKVDPKTTTLLSGGIDSSYIQAKLNELRDPILTQAKGYVVAPRHRFAEKEIEYAESAARLLNVHLEVIIPELPYGKYLEESIRATGEPQNHVQSAYFCAISDHLRKEGIASTLCGEGADSLFGTSLSDTFARAKLLRYLVPSESVRALLAGFFSEIGINRWARSLLLADHEQEYNYPHHPVNYAAVFSDMPSLNVCFTQEQISLALTERRSVLEQYQIRNTPIVRSHMLTLLTEGVETSSLWASACNSSDLSLFCPFMDSRMIRIAYNISPDYMYRYGRIKRTLKDASKKHLPTRIIRRKKLSFGQPIFDWMRPNGILQDLLNRLAEYDFAPSSVVRAARDNPQWFLYSLLCYDLWWKLFIEKSAHRV